MDIAGIGDSPWFPILAGWRKGRIDRNAIVRALEAGAPVPVEANALLAGLLSGEVKATRGLKPRTAKQGAFWAHIIASDVEAVEAELRQDRTRRRSRPNDEARALVAMMHGITQAAVGRAIASTKRPCVHARKSGKSAQSRITR